MSGKIPRMNTLQSRKQLLIVESELNRAQMIGDLTAMTEDVNALAARAKSFGSMATSAAGLVVGLANLRRAVRPVEPAAKPSWLRTIFKGAGLVSSLWMAFRSRRQDHDGHQPDPRF